MRTLAILPAVAALTTLVPVLAIPAPIETVVNVPAVGALTLGLMTPTNLPIPAGAPSLPLPGSGGSGPSLPVPGSAPKLPIGRREPSLARRLHNAVYQVDATAAPPIPSEPIETGTSDVEKRAPPPRPQSHRKAAPARGGSKAGPPAAPHQNNAVMPGGSSGPLPGGLPTDPLSGSGSPLGAVGSGAGASPFTAVSSAVQGVGAVPNVLGSVVYGLPLSGNPLTGGGDGGAVPPVDAPVVNKPQAPSKSASKGDKSNPPKFSQFEHVAPPVPVRRELGTTTDAFHQRMSKRHSMVFSTDPLMPSPDGNYDPKVGLVNIDSNRKPDPPVDLPEVPEPDTTATKDLPKPPAGTDLPQSPLP